MSAMPAQDDGGAEEGEEGVALLAPSGPGLGEVLQAGQGDQSLSAALADHGRQVGDGGDVRDLVEGQRAPADGPAPPARR